MKRKIYGWFGVIMSLVSVIGAVFFLTKGNYTLAIWIPAGIYTAFRSLSYARSKG